ncbi:hypothetical protein AB0H83_37600 [Dactylosporangium sp. NPDC050688]|uniref:hypothetical protein n=1 Tax=Dactylosporangium sp. NPDC050688 TaxID=3157217 RepID=UPI0033FF92D8
MAAVLEVLESVPGTSETVEVDRLMSTSVELARVWRRVLQDAGFDYFLTSDGGTYFKLLN